MRLVHVTLLTTLLAALLAAPGLAQTPPSTLTGEVFTGSPTVTSNCNTTGGPSTISYFVSGLALGPYSGPYFATGMAEIEAQPLPGFAVPVTSFTETFTIDSAAGQVTGTKRLISDPFLATGLGRCTEERRDFGVAAMYRARIATPAGTFADRGKTIVALNEPGLGGFGGEFFEFFISDLLAPEPVPEPAGRVTGGGSIVASNAYFGFDVERKEEGGPVRGEIQFVNQATGDIVHSAEVTDFVVIGNTAFFSFTCENQSADPPCRGDVEIEDNGQGSDDPPDTIAVTGVGFTGAAGAVDGDVDVHSGGFG